jgi:hypothetical protein
MVWLLVAGTALETRSELAAAGQLGGECYYLNGVWYCPCEGFECAPPDCMLINGEWYCEAG